MPSPTLARLSARYRPQSVLGGWALGSLWLLLVLAATQAIAGRGAVAPISS